MSRANSKNKGEARVASSARLRYMRGSAQKTRLVVDQIRGTRVDDASALLKASKRKAAEAVYKLLYSAVHNVENSPDNADIDSEELYVVRAWVDEGPVMKRIRPAPMGRAFQILKRQCHVTIELGTYGRG